MSEKRGFTGVFIPVNIWESKELIPAEKMLLGEIDALSKATGWCDASRAHFAEWLQCSPQNVTYYLSKLQRLGFIEQVEQPGYRTKRRVVSARFYDQQGVKGIYPGGKGDLPRGVKGIYPGGKGDLPEIQGEIQDEIKGKISIGADAPTEYQAVFSIEIFEPSKKELLTLETEKTKKKKAPAPRLAKLPTRAETDGAAYLQSIGQGPTLNPYQAEPTGDPVELAAEWMQANAEQVKIWQERAGTQFDNKRLKEEAVKYFAYYQAKHGPDHMANVRPLYFFQRSFGGWLMSAKHYSAPGAPKAAKPVVNDARGIDYSRPQKF